MQGGPQESDDFKNKISNIKYIYLLLFYYEVTANLMPLTDVSSF